MYLTRFVWLGIALLLSPLRYAAAQGAPETGAVILNDGSQRQLSTEGYYTLSWREEPPSVGGPDFELFEADDPSFEDESLIYRGPDLATTMSGQPNGVYHYRIRIGDDGQYSNAHTVTVRHHPLSRAFTFLGIGAVVFVATLGLILVGNGRDDTRTRPMPLSATDAGSDGGADG